MKKIQIIFFLLPDRDPDHSQNLMGSRLDQDPSSDFCIKFQPAVFAYFCKETNGHENNTSLEDVTSRHIPAAQCFSFCFWSFKCVRAISMFSNVVLYWALIHKRKKQVILIKLSNTVTLAYFGPIS